MPSGFKRVFLTPLTAVETTDKEGVGTLRFEGNKIYKWVKLQNVTATVAVVAGDAVAYLAATGHNTSQVVSDVSDADATQPLGAGIIMGTVAAVLATAYYCWIQIKGNVTVTEVIGGSAGDGHMLMMSTTDKTLTKLVLTEAAPNTILGACIGVATDASAKLVALDCVF